MIIMDADTLFKRASCGLALHGTYVGGQSELFGTKPAKKQLLRPPEVCDLRTSDQPFTKKSLFFSSIGGGEKFCEQLKDSGWSVAFKFSATAFGLGTAFGFPEGSLSAGVGKDRAGEMKSEFSQMTSEAYYLQSLYVPKASFRISREQMRLSEEALNDMRRIQTPELAVTFLTLYNSHLSTGTYDVGGILLKGVTIKSQSETTFESLVKKLSTEANAEAEASYAAVQGGLKVVYVNNKSSTSNSSTRNQEAKVTCVYTAIGPPTDDEEKFKAGLEDMSKWHIIDRSLNAELIPVWEIAEVETGLCRACKLLREAWQKSVEASGVDVLKTGRLYDLWSQSYQQARTNEVTRLLQGLEISSPPYSLDDQLHKLWMAASTRVTSDDSVPTSDRERLFEDANFQRLLSRIVESTDRDMDDAKAYVCKLVTNMQQLMPDTDVSVSKSVNTFLRSRAQRLTSTDRLPPLEELSNSGGPVEQPTLPLKNDNVWTPPKEGVMPEVIEVPLYNSLSKKNDLYTYNGDFLVDRPLAKSPEDLCKTMMELVKHRQEPFAAMSNTMQETSSVHEDSGDDDFFGSNDSGDCGLSSSPIDQSRGNDSPLEILVQLLRRSDMLVQVSLMQLLLEERFAVPLVIPCADDSNQFCQLVEALKFVKVKLANQEILTMAENTSLSRVVFVSNRVVSQSETVDVACEVLNCQFPSKYRKPETITVGSTVLEFGIGFLEDAKSEQSLKYVPCLAFYVSGDPSKLDTILEKVTDVVVVEMDLNEQPRKPSWTSSRKIPTRFWSISSSGRGGNRHYDHIWGNFKDITKGINQFLLKTMKLESRQRVDGTGALTLVQCLSSLAPLNEEKPTSSSKLHDAIEFDKVKRSLSLQRLYTEEAGYYFESLQKRAKAEKLGQMMKKCKADRRAAAVTVAKLPILRHFVQILRERNYVKRAISILDLQLVIDRKLEVILRKANREVHDAFEQTQKMPTNVTFKERYYVAQKEYVDQMLGVEHLWRELSHIFVADSKRQAHLPKLAAYHLLDGYPMEILDGDATFFHELWVDRVLVELNTQLHDLLQHEPKVFVLSVVGLQSSGKSTLLNVMFGTKLRASAGTCTRGVFLQLVKSEWPEFDYVLILDTMGLRSPEFFGLKDRAAQDNRMATFAVLPADACVVVVANEEDNGLKEVLPMVMLAYKGSALAEKYGKKMQAKLFFVYRSVDVNDTKKLERNQRKLKEDLKEASSVIGSLSYCGTSERVVTPESDGLSPLSNIQINTTNEKLSDVKFLGNIKKGTKPPGDTPDWEYGSKVRELREYIHKRVSNAGRLKERSLELLEWKNYLGMVWKIISESNFELSFLDYIEHASYQAMQTKLAISRQRVGKKWQDEFDALTNNLQGFEEIGDQPLATLWNILRTKVDGTVEEEEVKVLDILEQTQCKKWKVAETVRWKADCSANDDHWKGQLQDCIDGVLNFDKVVKDYTTKIQQEIMEAGVKHHDVDVDSSVRESRMAADFEDIFKRILVQAEIKHPPMAKKVAGRIQDMYVNDPVVGQQFSFADKKMQVALVEGQRDSLDESSGKEPGNMSTIDTVWNSSNAIKQAFKNVWKPFQKGLNEVTLTGSKLINDGAEMQSLMLTWKSILDDAGSIPKEAVDEIQKLTSKVMSHLEDVKQYSDHLVKAMIDLTKESGDPFPNRVRHCMHKVVKALLTARLTRVQEQWDSDHNVSKRLETQREYLWKQFQNHANKLDATNRLSMAFCDLLENRHLVDAFEEHVAKTVSTRLLNLHWVSDYEVMRAFLDLHLIELIESSQVDELLDCVSTGSRLYNTVVRNMIEKEMAEELKEGNAWNRFRDGICDSVRTAASKAGYMSRESTFKRPLVFQRSIVNDLDTLSPEVSRLIKISVSKEVCSQYGDDIDFEEVSKKVTEKVCGVHFNPTSSTSKMVDMVRQRMVDCQAKSMKARCDAMCPRCHVTCILPANHDPDKHDTLHQSEGLRGGTNGSSKELMYQACNQIVREGHWEVMQTRVPFKDYWLKDHSDWALPSHRMGQTKVREYIFANFQKEILQRHPNSKACSTIPPEFKLLQLRDLKIELESVIKSRLDEVIGLGVTDGSNVSVCLLYCTALIQPRNRVNPHVATGPSTSWTEWLQNQHMESRQSKNVMRNCMQAIHQRYDLIVHLKNLKCRTLILVGGNGV